MDILQVAKDFGWLAAIILFVIREVWPQAFGFLKSTWQKQSDLEIEKMRLNMQDGIDQAKADRDDRVAERQFRHELDERQIKAYEKLVETSQLQAQLLVTMNERINQLALKQNTMQAFLVDAVAQMRERMAVNHPPTQKLPPSGPFIKEDE